jgi:hypothetical protein
MRANRACDGAGRPAAVARATAAAPITDRTAASSGIQCTAPRVSPVRFQSIGVLITAYCDRLGIERNDVRTIDA